MFDKPTTFLVLKCLIYLKKTFFYNIIYKATEGGIRINKKYIILILIIGIIIYIINTFFYQLCIVHGDSMEPNLKDKQIVLMKKFNLLLNYNDIIVIKKNNKIIIKRLIGLPNDNIKIDDYVFVNNKKIDNLYTEDKGIISSEITLNSDEYFVLGDNRQHSIDSRYEEIGIILKEEIIGKIILPRK